MFNFAKCHLQLTRLVNFVKTLSQRVLNHLNHFKKKNRYKIELKFKVDELFHILGCRRNVLAIMKKYCIAEKRY